MEILKSSSFQGDLHNVWFSSACYIPYYFAYKTEFFPFQNDPKNLDPSYKMDLDFWHCLARVKLVLQQDFIGLI